MPAITIDLSKIRGRNDVLLSIKAEKGVFRAFILEIHSLVSGQDIRKNASITLFLSQLRLFRGSKAIWTWVGCWLISVLSFDDSNKQVCTSIPRPFISSERWKTMGRSLANVLILLFSTLIQGSVFFNYQISIYKHIAKVLARKYLQK